MDAPSTTSTKDTGTTSNTSSIQLCVEADKLAAMVGNGPYAMGIDEAGRGPVLGPMVYGAFWAPLAERDLKVRKKQHICTFLFVCHNVVMQGSGYDDSKKLSEDQRDKLFAKAKKSQHGWKVIVLHASELSNKMVRVCVPLIV
jgi:ribonuclease H2 subunit A